jgi:hypothetical protein
MSEANDKIIIKVQGLLAKAASTTPEEADLCRAKADELMTKYAIEQFQLERTLRTAQTIVPVAKDVEVSWYWDLEDEEVRNVCWSIFWECARHTRCELAFLAGHDGMVPVVGMPYDIDYMNILFTHLFMQMVDTMDPHPKAGESLVEALARMKEAGLKWRDIYNRLVDAGLQEDLGDWDENGVASKVNYAGKYTTFCTNTGRHRTQVSPSVFRRSFIAGFLAGLREKFISMRETQGQNTGSMALALKDYREEVKKAFHEFFPVHAPKPVDSDALDRVVAAASKGRRRKAPPERKFSYQVLNAGKEAGRNVDIISNEEAGRQQAPGSVADGGRRELA